MSEIRITSAQTGLAWSGDWNVIGNITQGFVQPSGITTDSSNNVYVVDSYNALIYKYGNGIWSIVGGKHFTMGSDYPTSIALDQMGNLYVANAINGSQNIIWSYNLNTTIWTDITRGRAFSGPTGITVDSIGNIYVSDTGNNVVVKMYGLGAWQEIGSWSVGQIQGPVGICVDAVNNLYVTNAAGVGYTVISKLPYGSTTWSIAFTAANYQMENPTDLFCDTAGNFYVTSGTDQFPYIAVLINGSNQWAYIEGGFKGIYGIAIDSLGNFYVSNININGTMSNSSVQKHQPWVYQIDWITQPGGALINGLLNPQPALQLEDIKGNQITQSDSEMIDISFVNSGGATLGGNTEVALVNGVAEFSDLSVNQVGVYSLMASVVIRNSNYWNYTSEGGNGISVTLISSNSNNFTINAQVATPTASITSGNVIPNNTVVYFACATSGATIYYTLDGSTPTTSSPSGTQVTITELPSASVVLKLMATATNMVNSAVAEYDYTMQEQVATPTASIASGTVIANNTIVTLSCITSGATIYYTLDGSNPTESSLVGTQVTITGIPSASIVLKMVAMKAGIPNSSIAEYDYTLQAQVATPTSIISSGSIIANNTVAYFACATTGATIYYTLDGSDPTTSSLSGTQVTITALPSASVVLKLMATATNMVNSAVAEYDYTMQPQVATPTASVASDSVIANNTVINLSCATTGAIIYYTLDGSDPTTSSKNGTQVTITALPSASVVLKLMATATNMVNSAVAEYDYTMQAQVATPTASVASDSVIANNTVINLSCATTGAIIYYTLDGSTPTKSSNSGTQVTITALPSASVVLKLMATASNMVNSAVAEYDYTMQAQVATPTASVASDSVIANNTVIKLSCATTGATIYYTLDGSTPTTSSLSGTQVTITALPSASVVLKLMATATNMVNSAVAEYDYTMQAQVEAPTAFIPSGTVVADNTVVNFLCGTKTATIYYTLDGSDPTTNCESGTQAIITGIPNTTVTLKLMAVADGMEASIICVFYYILESNVKLSVQKSVDTSQVEDCNILRYKIVIANKGEQDVYDAVLNDCPSQETRLIYGSALHNGAYFNWEDRKQSIILDTISAGEVITITYCEIIETIQTRLTITNCASLCYTFIDDIEGKKEGQMDSNVVVTTIDLMCIRKYGNGLYPSFQVVDCKNGK